MKNIKAQIRTAGRTIVLLAILGVFLLSPNNACAQSCGGTNLCTYIIESHYGSSGGVLITLDGGMTEEVLDSCAEDNQTLKEVTCGPDGTVIIEDKFCEWGCNNGACYPVAGGFGLPSGILVSSSAKHLELNWADVIYALGYKVTLEKESGEFISTTEVQDSYILLDGLKKSTQYIVGIVPFSDAGARFGMMFPVETDSFKK
jgi:hypothetical protein